MCCASAINRRVRMGMRGGAGGAAVVSTGATGALVVRATAPAVACFVAAGTVHNPPHALHLADRPANSSATLSRLWQLGQLNWIIGEISPTPERPAKSTSTLRTPPQYPTALPAPPPPPALFAAACAGA